MEFVFMLTKFCANERNDLVRTEGALGQAWWVDVLNPTIAEHNQLNKELQILLPWHHEIHQLEFSNRFYEETGALYLSLPIITKAAPIPESHVITLILTAKALVTLRYSDPNPIQSFQDRIDLQPIKINNHFEIFYLILERFVGSLADTFELIEAKSDELGLVLMGSIDNKGSTKPNLNKKLRQINYLQNLLAKAHQSLANINLLLAFFQQEVPRIFASYPMPDFTTLKEDIHHLSKHGENLSHKMGFQLQASLGLINIEQTHTIKIFTVLAMIFMPPTLIASIYGMNFTHMPELAFRFGYPLALGAMVVSAYLPYRFFKLKGWI